jgi:hypothetical protein
MKIIDRNGRLFGKISVIDLLVILVVAVMAVALYVKNNHKEITSTSTPNTTITYQILVRGIRTYVSDAVQVGDNLYEQDYTTGGSIGKITAIEVLPGDRLAEFDDGTVELAPVEDSVNLLITVEGEGIISDGRYLLNRIYDLGVNSSRNYTTRYAQFTGTVSSILD